MTTATLSPRDAAKVPNERLSMLALARVETLRLARHPVFVVAVLLLVAITAMTPFSEYANATYETATQGAENNLDWTVAPAIFLGLGGLIAMNRITTSTRSAGDLVSSTPVGESRRTLALCLACLLPAAIAVVCAAYVFTFWMVDPPVQSIGWREFGATPNLVALMASSVLASLGGPLLGGLVGRWWRWPTAAGITVVLLITWSVLSSAVQSGHVLMTVQHMAAPYTLAALGAYAHGTEGAQRRRLARLVAVVAATTVAALLASVLLGPEPGFASWDPAWPTF